MQISKQLSSMLTLIFIIVLTLISGCAQKNESEVQAPEIKIFKIGAILSMTGAQAYFGKEAKAGIELAGKELKEGLKEKGIELEIIYEDSQNIPEKAANAALTLLNVKKVNCLISLFPMCPVVNSVTQNRKDVLHLAATMSPDIVIPENTIRIYPSQVEEAQKMIDYMEFVEAKKVAIFHLTVKAHEETAAHIKQALENDEIKYFTETMEFTAVDIKAQMQNIKNFSPDLLMLILLPDFHQRVFKAINDVGGLPENVKIIGNISFLYPTETPKKWLENVVFIAPKPFIGGVNLPGEFQETFKEQSKMEPTIVSTFLYINIKILGEALLNGKNSSQDIIDFLTTTKTKFKTVVGEIEILPDGDCKVSLGYGVIKDGKRLPFTLGILEEYSTSQKRKISSKAHIIEDTIKIKEPITKISPPVVVIKHLKSGNNMIEAEDQIVGSSNIQIAATAVDRENGIARMFIKVNDVTVIDKRVSHGEMVEVEESIILKSKNNRIKIIVRNGRNVEGYSKEINIVYKEELLKGKSLPELVRYFFGKSRSWAVLIAVGNYSESNNGFRSLPYAVNDAEAVKKFLIGYLGFSKEKIFTLYDDEAVKMQIEKLLGDTLPKKLSKDDRLLIYFSGHGDQEEGKGSEKIGYLIPFDGRKDELFHSCIPMGLLRTLSRKIKAKQVLFILDSCFSGIAGTVFKKGGIPKETRKQVETFIASEGIQIMTAGSAGETVTMGENWNNHSVYTYYLLEGLKGKADYNKDEVISVRELQVYLDSTVPRDAKQTPQLFNINNSEGQFVFYKEGDF